MSKKRPPQNRPQRRTKQRRPLRAAPVRREPSLLDEVAERLRDPSPLALLGYVSALVSALDPRGRDPFDRSEPEMTLPALVDTFLDVPATETSALLAVIAAFTDDDLLRARIRRELAQRSERLPAWLARLGAAVPVEPYWVTHPLGDGENIVAGVDIPGGGAVSVSTYIDHNLGSVAKDAYPIDASMADIVAMLVEHDPDVDKTVEPLDPATARARLADAVDRGAMTYPPYETETWPASRPLLEWVASMLPGGGAGFDHREWTEAEEDALVSEFLDSEFGARYRRDPDAHGRLRTLTWFGTGYSTLDPYRWSAPKIELLLLDWIPRKVMDAPASLAAYPRLLGDFVRFGHDRVGIPDRLTQDALDVIADLEPEYLEIIGDTTRPQGVAALFAAMGLPVGTGADLEIEVGGPEALAALDVAPLPAEAFDEADLDEDLLVRLRPIAAQLAEVTDDVFDGEATTACLRLLRLVAVADPAVIIRAKRDDITAGAVCWMVGQANELFGPRTLVKDVLARFGVSGSVSQRAEAMRAALGLARGGIALGSPDLLVSDVRARICELRDLHAD